MPTGTVKWFNVEKGYGFIQPDDGGADAFVHISAVERSGMRVLVEGQQVEYELGMSRQGKPAAQDLKVIGGPSPEEAEAMAPRPRRDFGDRPGGGFRSGPRSGGGFGERSGGFGGGFGERSGGGFRNGGGFGGEREGGFGDRPRGPRGPRRFS
ncbi:cold-shock protein [Pedomonas sp. V897]|uniref:cold-shock protein n=1 Tax=Pedomonas sp. V897 TaxID=3446482 RepID=UPI003EE12AE4